MLRIVIGILIALATARGIGLGRGAMNQLMERGLRIIPFVAHNDEWEACFGAASREERYAGCSARAGDESETPARRAAAYVEWGELYASEDLVAAIDRFDLAIRLDPSVANYHVHRAFAQLSLGNLEEASASIDAASRLESSELSLDWARADLLFQRGLYEDSAKAFETIINTEWRPAIEPLSLANLHMAYSVSLFRAGQRELAEHERDAAIALDPDAMLQLRARCNQFATQSYNPSASRDICDAAIAYDPDAVSLHLYKAIAELRAMSWQGAIANSDVVIEATSQEALSPPDISTQEGRDAATRQAMNAGLHAQALYARGIARLSIGQEEAGNRDIAAAIARNSSTSLFFERLRTELDYRRLAAATAASELRPRLAP